MQILVTTTPQSRARRAAKTKPDVDSIVNSLSVEDKELLGCSAEDNWEYLSLDQGEHVLKRSIKYVDGEPASFFDLLDDVDHINVALATRPEYRGNGYASKVAKYAMNWLTKHPEVSKGREVIWGVREDNLGSVSIAESLGFERDDNSYNDGWINYVYRTD